MSTLAAGADQLGLERLAIDALGASMRAINHCVDSIRAVPLDATAAMTDNILQAMGIKADVGHANVGSVVASRLVALLQDLATAIVKGEALETTRPPDANPAKPRAPLCLLSLRDYTGVQAAIELLVTWGMYPCVETGILVPIDQRVVSKTMKIAKPVVAHGSQLPTASPHDQLYTVVSCLLTVLQLSQFKPMLLPAYLRDIFAALVYERHVSKGPHSLAAQTLLDALMDDLPLRVTMSSVRAVLGQCHRSPSTRFLCLLLESSLQCTDAMFKTQCGLLLTACVLKPGGVHSTVEVLLSNVDEGNTQARMQVASLIARCPRGYERDAYLAAVAPQLLQLLSAKDLPQTAKLLRETTGLILCQLILEYPLAHVDSTLLQPLLGPLLRVESQPRDVFEKSDDIHFIATEDELGACLAALNVMLLGPPPPAPVLLALAPFFRPLVLLYAFCVASKSYWKETVQQLLAAYIQAAPLAALLLQCAVAPVNPTHRASVLPVGFASASHLACTFSAGGSGGAAITALDTHYPTDVIVAGVVDLLQAPALEACDVVGDLFTSLLTSYMQLKTVQAQESAPSMLQLLVALTEVVGPAVLRSGASILQCLVTVIDMYTSSTSTHSVVCLGMVTTILEVGARDRAHNEEALLKQLLPSLEALSMHPKIDIAEMASELRLQLLARASHAEPEPKFTALTFANILALSEKDLQSPSVPLRARGLVRLNKLIRSREAIDVAALMKLFLAHLHDVESYVFLASIQALASLADMHPTIAIPMLLNAATDATATLSLDQRIKLSEALMFTARRCGEVLPAYSRGFVHAYLGAIRTTSATTDLADATYRASCLSNLAEVCGLLRWAIHPFLTDVLLVVKDVLQVERGHTEPQIALRRGAVYVLHQMLHLMGRDVFAIASEHMTPIYRLLKGVAGDSDSVCVFHATQALAELDGLMRGELFQVGRSSSMVQLL
ncbi:hypothetical protein SDRG_03543 [Saprolegnia diclina VS20]|uniref:Uncharacterized protein n=1 Tax=Saprolegnia diclina (strain VS20) TaxID=1156394 RepID=T0S2T2_SAPDV|nr:hypothetical protein SDRG_03543 [Saprolegnia diclina VS20]EQC39338.1 hypothetical protein SDRG_03543 [Saprolegnia diclina VS20]|eukprot:XP_008607399.1 hypothetical protein SDRG_03543 [Saprolegnia diclina VS20]